MSLPPPENSPREHFSQRIREHHHMALIYARTLAGDEHTARDLAQDAFLAAWQNWDRFDITRDFATWLRGILRNKWREHCRRHAKTSNWDDEALSQLEDSLTQIPQSNFFEQLSRCLDKLPDSLAAPVKAHYYQRLSTAETATQIQATEAATRKRLQRARKALKTCLTQSQLTHPA